MSEEIIHYVGRAMMISAVCGMAFYFGVMFERERWEKKK